MDKEKPVSLSLSAASQLFYDKQSIEQISKWFADNERIALVVDDSRQAWYTEDMDTGYEIGRFDEFIKAFDAVMTFIKARKE